MSFKGLFGFKVLFKGTFEILSKKSGRKFIALCIGHGEKKRFQPGKAKLFGNIIQYVDNMSFLWQFHDIFVKEVYKFTTNNAKPLIIDCGSNIGLSVLYFKMQYPHSHIIAFEADSEIYRIQKENTDYLQTIESYGSAVWTHDKGINLFRNNADGAYVTEKGEDKVASVRLRDLLASRESVDLLKLDIEGAEFDVIEDCSDQLYKVDKLFVELHTFAGQSQKVSELIAIIESSGFRYFIENANYQNSPLGGNWKAGDTGMDMQLNLYAIRE